MSLPIMPTLDELLIQHTQPAEIREKAAQATDPLDPIHLFNMNWKNAAGEVHHRVIPPSLTGVKAPIVVMCAAGFPTGSHKVGPAYSCVREALLGNEVSDGSTTLVFPSTGNLLPRNAHIRLVFFGKNIKEFRFE